MAGGLNDLELETLDEVNLSDSPPLAAGRAAAARGAGATRAPDRLERRPRRDAGPRVDYVGLATR